ncbi:DUF523 domain-containing protein [bacterium]|nr:DUF523 domain-containing protein [bacterium]
MPRFLISACLLGIGCTYSGRPNRAWEQGYKELIEAGEKEGFLFFPICPEQLGGLPTPRAPAEIDVLNSDETRGIWRVVTFDGIDVTNNFLLGAAETLRLSTVLRIGGAILKDKSPSCGIGLIHKGSFDGSLVPGNGISASFLKKGGVPIFSNSEFFNSWKKTSGFGFLPEALLNRKT